MTNATPSAELRIPPPRGIVGTIFLYAMVLLPSALALWNLLRVHQIPITSTIASVLWLGFVYMLVSTAIREEGGVRPYVITRLGGFSGRHFARIHSGQAGVTWLVMGYRLCGREFYYLDIETTDLCSVTWHAGQASGMSGRDFNDWSVAVWYHDPNRPVHRLHVGSRNEQLLIVGPWGSRAEVTAFGQQLVKFLKSAGVSLTPGKNECEFITSTRRGSLGSAKASQP